MKRLCIYHGNCADGFGAAWVVRKVLGEENVEFHAGVYQNPPPDVTGRDVILVDFSYKREVLEPMIEACRSLLIIDHHKTAAEDLAFLPDTWPSWREHTSSRAAQKAHKVFDMERSGAGLAWDFFFGSPRPRLIDHIEDRDLWRFALDGTREIQAALFSYPYDFATWDTLVASLQLGEMRLVGEGGAIERKHHKDVDELVRVVTRPMRFRYPFDYSGSVVVPIANLPYTLTSDAGHLLCNRDVFGREAGSHPFAGCYWDTPDGRVFSLRSRDDGADVGEIAKLYGGGGHKHASGFRVPFDQLEQFEPGDVIEEGGLAP